jgi:copper resistance protein B
MSLALAFAAALSAQAPDPHAHHHEPAPAPTPAKPPATDPHAHHHTPAPASTNPAAPPIAPSDHAADRLFDPTAMAAAREVLRREHGVMRWTLVKVERLEVSDHDQTAWEAEVSTGGDLNRLVLSTEGHDGEAEAQVLWRRAIGPYFNLQAGVRHDLGDGPNRTYAALGVEGLAPYWVEVEAQAFLSDRGRVSARLEAMTDYRLTQRLILEPRAELNLAKAASELETGLRLRYAITPLFAPYAGVVWSREFTGRDRSETSAVFGLSAWF